MRTLALALMLFALALPALANQATLVDRKRFAQEISNSINVDRATASAFHGLRDIQVGNGVVDRSPYARFALADWRSRSTAHHGQVAFYYACDHWNIGPVGFDRQLKRSEIARMPNYVDKHNVPAAQLIAELAALDSRHIAYVALPKPNGGC